METSNSKNVELAQQIKKESIGQLGKSGSADVFTANSSEMETPSSNNQSAIGVSNPFFSSGYGHNRQGVAGPSGRNLLFGNSRLNAVFTRNHGPRGKGTMAQKDAARRLVLNSKTLREAETMVEVHYPMVCSNMTFMTWMRQRFPNHDFTPRKLEEFLPQYQRVPQSMLEVMNSRAIFISGKSGIGKTEWIRAIYPRHLYATKEADLKAFVRGVHEGIIFDGLQPKSLNYDNLLAFIDIFNPRGLKIRNKYIELPGQLPRIAISNLTKEDFITAVAELHKELSTGGYSIPDKFRWRIVEWRMTSKLW